METKAMKLIIVVLFLSLSLILLTLYTSIYRIPISKENPIHSDGNGYYSYLPAVFINGDLLNITNPYIYDPYRDYLTYPSFNIWPETQRYLNKYPMGTAILQFPGFLIATVASLFFGFPIDGYNIFYQAFIGILGSVYAISGLALCYLTYHMWHNKTTSLMTILVLLFGTNLLHYATYDSTFSHVYAFFTVSLTLYLISKWHDNPRSWLLSILLGISIGINIIIRQSHVLILLVWLLFDVYSLNTLKSKIELLKKNWKNSSTVLIFILLVLVPQLLYYVFVTHRWYIFPYINETFHWFDPAWYGVLFSPRKGLLFWTPVLLLNALSLVHLGKIKQWLVGTILFLALEIYVIASWHQWWYGDSYGHRAFIDLYPIIGLFLAQSLNIAIRNRLTTVMIYSFISICISANIFFMLQYWKGVLPRDNTTLEMLVTVMSLGSR